MAEVAGVYILEMSNFNQMLYIVLGRYGVKDYIKIAYNISNMHTGHDLAAVTKI